MKPYFFLPSLLLTAAISPTLRAQNAAPIQATLRVQADQPGLKISPNLYGAFFEEINHAGDGGLYAEMVRNRDFNDSRNPMNGWSLQLAPGAKGSADIDLSRPLNAATPRALKIEATEVPSSGDNAARMAVAVANEGYWGMGVKSGATYRLNFFARRNAGTQAPLHVALVGKNNRVYAASTIKNIGADWSRHNLVLKANASATDARLMIGLNAPGTVYIDVVSLFPQSTFKNRRNGLRPDLAQKVAAMKPAFLRFPGGCYIEGGDHYANAFRWKTTVGDIAQRPGHLNDTWGYWSTDGLGYHEYLQMCEDVGATALYVVNCGMAHRSTVPMGELQPWIDEALDAIEYANGPATSKWGALRAKNGHPKPFNLRYLQIGNENGGPLYNERYAAFVDAIKAKHPNVRLIANNWGSAPTSRPIDILDEHYYNTPEWFWDNSAMYDSRDRKTSPKIYIGEYAVTSGQVGQGNLRAALSEAAFMNGMERNSDIVEMGSYAPLFVNIHNRAWNPNAIGFDNSGSFGTPSYYVQMLYSQNRPDRVLPSQIAANIPAPPATAGSIGVGTWLTQAEFKEVEVTLDNQNLYRSDWTRDAANWKSPNGSWKAEGDAYRQSGTGTNSQTWAILQNSALMGASDYTINLKARKLSGEEGFFVLFRSRDQNNFYWWNVGGWGNTAHGIEKSAGGGKSQVGSRVPGRIETNRWYDVRIELLGNRIRCYLDGKLVHDIVEGTQPRLNAIAGRDRNGDIVVKVVNGLDAPVQTQIDLAGVGKVSPTARATVLRGTPDDENSLAQPTKVAPIQSDLKGIAPRFSHTFAPHSLTILRLKAR